MRGTLARLCSFNLVSAASKFKQLGFNQPRYNAQVQSGNRRMTPQQFITKWQGCQLAERAFYQQHFNDLCALVGHPTPAAQDTMGETLCFEKGASIAGNES